MDAHITIDAKPEIIDSVTSFGFRWCINSGLEREEATRFALALDELITNIILFAYPEEKGTFDVTFRNSLSNVESIITETGEPFDPDRHNYDPKKAISEGNFEGAGLRLVRLFTDDFIFVNRGKQGKEFRISKSIKEPHIKELKPELQPAMETKGAGAETYSVKAIRPSDAEDVSKLIYRTYDYSYTKEDVYFPKKVERAIAQKKKMGVIARSENQEAVGYFAIIQKDDSNIAEIGEAVVSPPHRRRGLMSRMIEKLIDIAEEQGLLGVYGTAITHHSISQRVNHKFGFLSTALELAKSDSVLMKSLREEYPQPSSTVFDFLPLRDFERPPLFLPDQYASIIKKIYASLCIDIEPGENKSLNLASNSNIDVKIDYKDHVALILVERFGKDFAEVFREISVSLEGKKLNALYCDLPLDQPAAPLHLDILRKQGFFFSGLMPLFHEEKDYLRLQKVLIPLDLNLIEVYSDMAKQIKNLITEEYNAG